MMKISKTNARITANEMTKAKDTELQKIEHSMQLIAQKAAIDSVPKQVSEAAKSHPKYFKWNSGVRPFGEGVDTHRFFSTKDPIPSTSNYQQNVELKGKELLSYIELDNKYRKLQREIKVLQEDIYKAVLGFSTEARLKKEWPECYEHYPERKSTELTKVDVKSIMNRL